LKLENTLEFVFFDGEEAVVEWTDDDSVYGSSMTLIGGFVKTSSKTSKQ
jgi:hypothetical protein